MVQINRCNKYTSMFHIRIIKYVNLLSILSPRWKDAQQKSNFKYFLNFDTTFYTIQISFNLITKRNKVISFLSLRDYLIFIVSVHSGPENLKKSRQNNSSNQINQFHEIAFLADLNFFPVQNLILKLQKMDFGQ